MQNERDLFDAWHLKQFKDINCDLSNEAAKILYDRVYSHDSQNLIRQMEFNAWLSSINRQGYKLVPIEPTEDMINKIDGIFEVPSWDSNITVDNACCIEIYKAMIEAADD